MPILNFKCNQTECPVFKKCCFLPTSYFPIKNKVDILFVGMGGGIKERKQRLPFVGPAGKRLKNCIIAAKKIRGKSFGVAFSNTIRDNPENNREPTEEELKYCLQHLYKDILYLKEVYHLRAIMPLGNHAKKIFIDNKINISADRKNIYNIDNKHVGSIIVKPSLHPSFLIRNGSFDPQKGKDKLLIEDILELLNA